MQDKTPRQLLDDSHPYAYDNFAHLTIGREPRVFKKEFEKFLSDVEALLKARSLESKLVTFSQARAAMDPGEQHVKRGQFDMAMGRIRALLEDLENPDPPSVADPTPARPALPGVSRREDAVIFEKGPLVYVGCHGDRVDLIDRFERMVSVFGAQPRSGGKENQTIVQIIETMKMCHVALLCVTRSDIRDETNQMPDIGVLVQIGATLTEFGDRYLVLWEDTIEIPTLLQSLNLKKVRFPLSADSTLEITGDIGKLLQRL